MLWDVEITDKYWADKKKLREAEGKRASVYEELHPN